MGRGKRNLPSGVASGPKERHKRAQRPQYDHLASVPEGFVAKPAIPKSKHHTYYEFVDNTDKKKKLEFEVTTKKTPPPGFEFVPIGNPRLTTACKELSREKDVMIFIVSNAKHNDASHLANQVHRIGLHVRQAIVEEAKAAIGSPYHDDSITGNGQPEPIPESQAIYHAQVDGAIRDLFPRIPNTDRQMIIEHAFTRSSTNKPEKVVGFSEDISLARRVQLAVLAHIRHNHTRYDALLREANWQTARKVVEGLCLDILVKWRGDEETGRDQLDEILREVVVISDSENDESEDESTDISSVEDVGASRDVIMPDYRPDQDSRHLDAAIRNSPNSAPQRQISLTSSRSTIGRSREANRNRRADKVAQRGFKRYRAWEEAIRRNRGETPAVEHHPYILAPAHRLYQQHETSTGFQEDNTSHANPDSRTGPLASGTPPTVNGYVPQRRPAYESSSVNSSPYGSRNGPVHSLNEKVTSPVQLTASSVSRQPISSAANHFQDMLVYSIEPVSPGSRSLNVRPLALSGQEKINPSPPNVGLHQLPGSGPPGNNTYAGEFSYSNHGQASFPSIQQDPRLGTLVHGSSTHPVNHSDPNQSQYSTGDRTIIAPPVDFSSSHGHDVGFVGVPVSRRIVVNAPRPGERSNPILMEDRGGFYERINTRPEDATRLQMQDPRPVHSVPPTVDSQGFVRPHRVVSWDEGSRIVNASHGAIEIIPKSGSHPRVTSTYSQAPPDYSNSQGSYEKYPDRQPQHNYRETPNVNSRPVLRMEYGALPPEGYWVIQRSDRPLAPPQLGPVHQEYRDIRPPTGDPRYDPRRDHRSLPPPPPPPARVVVTE